MPKADRLSAGGVKLLSEPHLANLVTLMTRMVDEQPAFAPDFDDVLQRAGAGSREDVRQRRSDPDCRAWRQLDRGSWT